MKPDDCTNASRAEWIFKEDNPFWPGMPKEQRKAAAERAEMAKYVRPFSQMWQGAKELLLYQEVADAVSGQMFLKKNDNKELVLLTRGVSSIPKQWQIPTLIMDATLPELEILQAFFPTVEVLASIEAEMPHVTVRQVVWAPVSSRKLQPTEDGPTENMLAIRRAILWRYIEVGRKPTLVITQKDFALWLRASGLPDGVSFEWFNNVAGLDHYKDVRLIIAIGRTLPDVFTVEALAGALTGLEPLKAPEQKNGTRWYNRVALGARLRDGSGVKVESDRHPDPMAEAVRWQICEKEVLQAIGRGRPTNRTAETPLDIDIMVDEVLPITIDRVMTWDQVEDGLEIQMLIEGVYLDSPTDMAACWPDVWITANAAECWQRRAGLTGRRGPIEKLLYRTATACARYQLPGARQRWRTAWFDLSLVPDPRTWLEQRLGSLVGFELTFPHPELEALDRLFSAAAEATLTSPSITNGRTHAKLVSKVGCYKVSPSEQPAQCRHHPPTKWKGLLVRAPMLRRSADTKRSGMRVASRVLVGV